MKTEELINELQSFGLRLADPTAGAASRRGGAGPSDHKAITIDGMTVMAPVHTAPAFESPYIIEKPDRQGLSRILRDGLAIAEASFPAPPKFYALKTADGVPYSKIAVLHGRDVLATTVLQTCIRYRSRTKTCQFCAIGQSLAAGRTVERPVSNTRAAFAERLRSPQRSRTARATEALAARALAATDCTVGSSGDNKRSGDGNSGDW
jgi:radical SAM protein (TIGR04043 family)